MVFDALRRFNEDLRGIIPTIERCVKLGLKCFGVEGYSEPFQTSKMEFFTKKVN